MSDLFEVLHPRIDALTQRRRLGLSPPSGFRDGGGGVSPGGSDLLAFHSMQAYDLLPPSPFHVLTPTGMSQTVADAYRLGFGEPVSPPTLFRLMT